MITIHEIREIFKSSEYQRDLEELSSYAMNIRQERPIVLFLSKYLSRQLYKVSLEQNKHDLVVDGKIIEFKFHYDCDIKDFLEEELKSKYEHDSQLLDAINNRERLSTWSVMPGIYKDVFLKKADIFIWIICERDLSSIKNDDDFNRICESRRQLKYNQTHPYGSTGFLRMADSFLSKLQERRKLKFSIDKVTIPTRGYFPSNYHIRLCEFEKTCEN